MIKLARIDHINMQVRNVARSKNFYESLFGFALKESGSAQGKPWAILGVSDKAYLCLYESDKAHRANEGILINHFGFHVKNFREIEASLKEKKIKINYGGVIQNGKSRSIYIEDPDGYEIELSETIGGGLH